MFKLDCWNPPPQGGMELYDPNQQLSSHQSPLRRSVLIIQPIKTSKLTTSDLRSNIRSKQTFGPTLNHFFKQPSSWPPCSHPLNTSKHPNPNINLQTSMTTSMLPSSHIYNVKHRSLYSLTHTPTTSISWYSSIIFIIKILKTYNQTKQKNINPIVVARNKLRIIELPPFHQSYQDISFNKIHRTWFSSQPIIWRFQHMTTKRKPNTHVKDKHNVANHNQNNHLIIIPNIFEIYLFS